MNNTQKTIECPRGFSTKNEIESNYAENVDKCNACDKYFYESGLMMCKYLMNEERN